MARSTRALCLAGMAGCAAAFVAPAGRGTVWASRTSAAAPQTCRAVRMAEETYPDTELTRRFGSLRGAHVKPVSETIAIFNELYPKPVMHSYRQIVNELLQNTHLTVVDARFQYDPIFGYGMISVYTNFMRSYPGGDSNAILAALVGALGLDLKRMEADAADVAAWADGKDEEEVLAVLKGDTDGGKMAPVFKAVREAEFFLYNRIWGIGMFSLMEKACVEPSPESVERWFGALGVKSVTKAKVDLDQYNTNMERIAQAEQMFKEIEIREKKRMAERLEAKAKAALEKAEEAEKAAAAAAPLGELEPVEA